MSEDGQPADEPGHDELIAAFAALGGKLTKGELEQLLGPEEYYLSWLTIAGSRWARRADLQVFGS